METATILTVGSVIQIHNVKILTMIYSVLYYMLQYSTLQCIILFYCIVLYYILYSTIWFSSLEIGVNYTIQYYVV